ncbi:hypothetical protein ACO0QE_004736 [Hanseniaspora vineae]
MVSQIDDPVKDQQREGHNDNSQIQEIQKEKPFTQEISKKKEPVTHAHVPHFNPNYINYYSNDGKHIYSLKSILYSIAIFFFNLLFTIFFRKIDIKGSHYLIELQKKCNSTQHKQKESILIMCAPHANQFIDPGLVMSQVYNVTANAYKRELVTKETMQAKKQKIMNPIQPCMVTAKSSFDKMFISQFGQMTGGIPVPRAQDYLKKIDENLGLVRVLEKESSESEYRVRVVGVVPQVTNAHIKQVLSNFTEKGLIGITGSNSRIKYLDLDHLEMVLMAPLKGLPEYSEEELSSQVEAVSFKYAPKIDNSKVFEAVFDHLNTNGCIGIFPEGGSHDRPQLLPIKPGVAIMALGATCGGSNLRVNIIPCGLNYFNRDKFRSRAVLEFGEPIPITYEEWGRKYEKDPRGTVAELMPILEKSLYSVTINTPDYDTLKIIQTARRLLYKNNTSKLSYNVEINRKLIEGYNRFGKTDERLIELKNQILKYNKELYESGLKDHQVVQLENLSALQSFALLLARFFKLAAMVTLALPGSLLFSPIFVSGHYYSKKKAKEGLSKSVVKIKGNDLLATWKLVVALAMAPVLYITYSLLFMFYFLDYHTHFVRKFCACYAFFVFITYISLKTGEIGMDIFKSLPPLFISLIYPNWKLQYLQKFRSDLQQNLKSVCDDLGPKIWDNYAEMTSDFEEKLEQQRSRSRSASRSRSVSRTRTGSTPTRNNNNRLRSSSIGSSILGNSRRNSVKSADFSHHHTSIDDVYDNENSTRGRPNNVAQDDSEDIDEFEIVGAQDDLTDRDSSDVGNKITERIRKSRKA